MRAAGLTNLEGPWDAALRDAMLETVWAAGSSELFLPIQDVFGWRDRINTPGDRDRRTGAGVAVAGQSAGRCAGGDGQSRP